MFKDNDKSKEGYGILLQDEEARIIKYVEDDRFNIKAKYVVNLRELHITVSTGIIGGSENKVLSVALHELKRADFTTSSLHNKIDKLLLHI